MAKCPNCGGSKTTDQGELNGYDRYCQECGSGFNLTVRLPDPEKMAYDDMVECLRTLQQTLWPNGDKDHEWDADTMTSVAGILTDAGLGPDAGGS